MNQPEEEIEQETRFEISFHGPAVENHSISARDVGRTLIATDALVEKISAQILPDNRAALHVQATRPGSYDIPFLLYEWVFENQDTIIELLRFCFSLCKDRGRQNHQKSDTEESAPKAEKVGPDIHIHHHYHLSRTSLPPVQNGFSPGPGANPHHT